MTLTKDYLLPRVLFGLMALVMAAATIPAYGNPTSNPGLTELTEPAVSLGLTARAFLARLSGLRWTCSTPMPMA
jgi:hypothetical protein